MVATPLVYTFENKGDVIEAENVIAHKFLKVAGRQGFGIAPTDVILRRGARGGAKFRRSRRNERVITFPVVIYGEDREQVEGRLRRFARLLQDDEETPRLVVCYPNGKRLYTEIHYKDGGDVQYGSDDTNARDRAKWSLQIVAPDPYWTEEDPTVYTVGAAQSGRSIIPKLAELALSSSQTLGILDVENPGDVEAYPVWQIMGPADSFTAQLPDGRRIKYNAAIGSGHSITINTHDLTVKDELGVNKYINLDTAPKFFPIPSGNTKISVIVENSTVDSRVSMYFNARRELVF